ncbi:PrsW family intramembrane metalloprotease [Planctomonas sp. JC2975]|uniref:PrsW family intramembrane metalloprotease n=1 Tax=Planctomonas sp. JC2975 TaxID=2729626 RepID=UPI00147372B4|nr:PrsW family glutamic-type intramembrane protease [Planctomonas sp. JC2975]NNC11736.1 PrsW family intramembrane metalloprotease [Planctomonas sp. JC2975]
MSGTPDAAPDTGARAGGAAAVPAPQQVATPNAADQAPQSVTPTVQPAAPGGSHAKPKRHGWWWKTLLGGVALWIIAAAVTFGTQNTNLVPTVILLGSFLVPFSVVMYASERTEGNLDMTRLILAFFIGGVFGVLGASILEVNLQPSWYMYLGIGAIEEFCKGAVFVVIGLAVRPKNGHQGALLGAVVGAGFAAFESAGYAFNAGLTRHGIDLLSMLQTEAVRGVLTPVGHVLWTAILGAAIFAAIGRTAKWWAVVIAFVAVAVLHSLWDSMSFIATLLAVEFTGGAVKQLSYGLLLPATAESISSLAQVLYVVGLIVISVIGILVLSIWGRRPKRPRPAAPAAV